MCRTYLFLTFLTVKTIFETPVLSNNSIVRLKSPLVKLYLSNNDTRNLCNEVKNDLLLIIYNLTSNEVRQGALSKLKIGQTMDFVDLFDKLPVLPFKPSDYPTNDENTGKFHSHLSTIERLGKHQYKLRFKKCWEIDIFITDIRKLALIRNSLLYKSSGGRYLSKSTDSILSRDVGSMKVLKRKRIETKEAGNSEDPLLILESDEEQDISNIQLETMPIAQKGDSIIDTNQEFEKKPLFEYRYQPMISYGKCVEFHVLKRPRRNASKGESIPAR